MSHEMSRVTVGLSSIAFVKSSRALDWFLRFLWERALIKYNLGFLGLFWIFLVASATESENLITRACE